MKITFTGTLSTGKTTLFESLKKDERFANFTFIEEIIRKLQAEGLPVNEDGGDVTQIALMKEHLKNNKIKDFVLDRCALDGLAFTLYAYNKGKLSKETLDYATKVFEELLPTYNYIFFLEPEFKLEDDGFRSLDEGFRTEIHQILLNYIKKYKIKVYKLNGSVENRIKQMNKIIRFH